jgi:5'-nucleotidase
MVQASDPRGRPIYWVGPPGPEEDAGPGTDFHAVKTGHVSVTPLQVDMTHYRALDAVARWLADFTMPDFTVADPGGPNLGAIVPNVSASIPIVSENQ